MQEFVNSAPLWLPGLMAMSGLILASGFFSSSETAFFYLSRDQIRNFSAGSPRQRMVSALLSDPDRLLSGILFWNLVINLGFFAVSVAVAHRLANDGQSTAAMLFGFLSLFAMILLGEVGPKSVAVAFGTRLAPLVSWPLAAAVRVLDPIVPSLGHLSRILRRTFWPHIKREPYLRPQDLEMAVENTGASQQVIGIERDVLHNILDLSEIAVEEVMRPRGMFCAIRGDTVSTNDLDGELSETDYIILQDDEENALGAIALGGFSNAAKTNLGDAVEDVLHVPWCANLATTLQTMRDRFTSIAIVVNEYGESVGVVAYEDIIDTIVLSHSSRGRRVLRREPVLEVDQDLFHVDGITTLRYLAKRLDIEFDAGSETQTTIGGMLNEHFERFPEVGDEITWRGHVIRVIEVADKGQFRAMVSPVPDESDS